MKYPCGMTHEKEVLWLLRIYGPCSFRRIFYHARSSRESAWSALTRLREKGLAQRSGRALYELTAVGTEHIEVMSAARTRRELF